VSVDEPEMQGSESVEDDGDLLAGWFSVVVLFVACWFGSGFGIMI
jgi:hypothetical protein